MLRKLHSKKIVLISLSLLFVSVFAFVFLSPQKVRAVPASSNLTTISGDSSASISATITNAPATATRVKVKRYLSDGSLAETPQSEAFFGSIPVTTNVRVCQNPEGKKYYCTYTSTSFYRIITITATLLDADDKEISGLMGVFSSSTSCGDCGNKTSSIPFAALGSSSGVSIGTGAGSGSSSGSNPVSGTGTVTATGATATKFKLFGSLSIEPAYQVLTEDKIGIKKVWSALLNLANGLVILVLIFVAFAQILRLNINTYGVKKILPSLILAIIAANFSWLFCRLLVDFANVILTYLVQGGTANQTGLTNVLGSSDNSYGWASPTNPMFGDMGTNGGTVFWFLLIQLVLLVNGTILFILSFLFFIRLWIIYFAVALAPLAFMAMAIPQTKSLFNQWWSNFSKWVFMPVVSVFWIWLGSQWVTASPDGWFMHIVFALACFYLAITTPFKMGGAIMTQWGNLGKKAWGRTGGAAWNSTGGAIGTNIKAGANAYYDRQKGFVKNRLWDTKAGRAYKARQYDFSTRNELPGLVSGKREKDARKLALLRMYKQDVDPDNKFNLGASRSRVVAELRAAAGDEASTTYNSMDAQGAKSELDRLGALDANGKLISEVEIAKLKEDYPIMVHGLLKRIGQLRNNTATRDEARQLFGGTIKDRSGNEVPHDGIFGSVEEANRAFARDFGNGVRDGDKNNNLPRGATQPTGWQGLPPGAGISPVGINSGLGMPSGTQAMALEEIVGKDKMDKLISGATHKGTSLDEVMKEAEISLDPKSDEYEALKEAFEGIRGNRDGLVEELYGKEKENINDIMIGLNVCKNGTKGKLPGPGLKNKLEAAEAAFGRGDPAGLKEAQKMLDEIGFQVPALGGDSPDKQRATVEKQLRQFRSGGNYLAHLGQNNPTLRNKFINSGETEESALKKEIESSLQTDARYKANIQATSQISLGQVAAKPEIAGLSIGQFMGGEHMEHTLNELTDAIHGLRGRVGGGDEIGHTTLGLGPEAMAEREGLKNIMRDNLKEGFNGILKNPNNQNMTAQAALSEASLINAVYRGMDKAARVARVGPATKVNVINKPAGTAQGNTTVINQTTNTTTAPDTKQPPHL